jgi:hypothetical protein
MVSATIQGKGVFVQIQINDELDERIVELAIDMAKRREIKLLPAPKDIEP